MTSLGTEEGLRVVHPGAPEWDEVRRAWNLAVDQRPAAIVVADSARTVVEGVGYARENGLRVAVQGTGHGAAPMGPLDGTLLVRTDRLRGVEIDVDARVARVQAGTHWAEVIAASAPHGLAPLSGSSAGVGAVGYTLGGGLSFLGRKFGLAAHAVVAADVVTADGALVRADEDANPELLWGLRGGGGNFGAVTRLEVRLFPVSEVYAGVLWFPFEQASEVLHTWAELCRAGLPDELTTVGRLLQLPPIEEIPEPVRGRSFAIVEVIHCGDPAEADTLLEPLHRLGPVMDTIKETPMPVLGQLHMDPDHPVPAVGDGLLLESLPTEAVDEIARVAGPGSGSPLLSVEIRQLGGALGEPRPQHAVLASVAGDFALYAVGFAMTPELGGACTTHVGALSEALSPWTAPQMFANFAETRRDPASFWGEAAFARLRGLKTSLDPEDVFRSNHPILPSTRA
jgi:FAD binding domain/Berberine and berberine like